MPETTDTKPDKTSEEEGKNTEGTATGAATQTAKTEDAPKFTQADLDRIASNTRKEEQEKARKAKEKEEQAQKAKQGEFEGLYNELKPQHESLTAEHEKYKTAVKTLAETELEALPEEVKDIAPSLDDPLAVLAWLSKGKKLAEKLNPEQAKRGMGRDPRPAAMTGAQAVEENKKAARASGKYTVF